MATESTDSGREPTIDELIQEGRSCLDEGRPTDAEEFYRRAFDRTRGEGTADEARATGSLAMCFATAGRRHEAILLFSRAVTIHEALGVRGGVITGLANLCSAYITLNLMALARTTLARLDASLEDAPEEDKRQVAMMTVWQRAQCALDAGETQRARSLFTDLRDVMRERTDPGAAVTLAELECAVLLQEQRPDEALAIADGLRLGGGDTRADELCVLEWRLKCLQALGQAADHEATAHRASELLLATLDEAPSSDLVLSVAQSLAPHLAEYSDLRKSAQRAYDGAATMLIRRLNDLDACMARLPEFASSDLADLDLVRHLRNEYASHQQELMAAVVRRLWHGRRSEAKFLFKGEESARLPLCAWCGRIRSAGGRWLPIPLVAPRFTDKGDEMFLTHGVCLSCRAEVAAM